MTVEAVIAALTSFFPGKTIWCEAKTGEITVETGICHKWPAALGNRARLHFPGHYVSLCPHGNIRFHTGIKLSDITTD